jgi:Rap1a immunity proteins
MRSVMFVLLVAVSLWPFCSEAVTRDNFLIRNTQDFVEICSVPEKDPLHAAALGFCHGYGVGAVHYYLAAHAGPEAKKFVCLPDPPPSRTEGVQMFLAWARENPQYLKEPAVETIFRWLASKWPCPK